MGKPAQKKQFTRPPKKQKPKASAPESADDFQEAADREEETGGKWRAGDSVKSGRAFVRALEIYDQGLQRHPASFDLAYNKARLLLEITQQPALVEHIGLPLADLLERTLDAHRYAMRFNEENPDVLFNTSQTLTSLAEELSESGQYDKAIPLLQEALELLSACLSRQEMLLEQQQSDLKDLQDFEDGGVKLDEDERPASTPGSEVTEQTATVETPVTANDLLDTVHASLAALTTLVPLVEHSALQTYGGIAQALTEKKAASYLSLLPEDLQASATFAVSLDKAIFVAAFADAQYGFYMIELETYIQHLDVFSIPDKDNNAHALVAEAEARTELAVSVLERFEKSPDLLPVETCWKQLSLAQDACTLVTKLTTEDAKTRKASVYKQKGDVELMRHRLASRMNGQLSDSIKRSAQTLIQNAQTYYKGAAQLAHADDDDNDVLEVAARQRWHVAANVAWVMYGVATSRLPAMADAGQAGGDVIVALKECVEEGLVEMAVGEELMRRLGS